MAEHADSEAGMRTRIVAAIEEMRGDELDRLLAVIEDIKRRGQPGSRRLGLGSRAGRRS